MMSKYALDAIDMVLRRLRVGVNNFGGKAASIAGDSRRASAVVLRGTRVSKL